MPQSEQRLRQPVVVVLGHVDSGKCVSGDTPIQLADGRIIEAQHLFEKYKSGEPVHKPDGEVYEANGLEVLSLTQDGRVVPKKVSHVWKLRADRLIEVQTKAGYSVKCTPEHKFLVMTGGGEFHFVEAEKLRLGDHLILPSQITVVQSGIGRIKAEILSRLSDDFLIKVSPPLSDRIKTFSRRKRQEIGSNLGDSQFLFHVWKGYYRASVFRKVMSALGIHLGEAYDDVEGIKFASPKRRATHKSPWISLPKSEGEFEALSYIVGLLYGDGVAKSARLANTSDDIMDVFSNCLLAAFGVGATKAWRRTSYIVSHKGGKSLARFLTEVFDYPMSDKARSMSVPEVISLMSDDHVAAFLRGFFDAEGFVQEGRSIGVGCESVELMRRLPMLLQRFGCLAYFGKKSHSREIYISGKDYVSAFVRHIGFRDREKMLGAKIRLRTSETNRVFDLTPIPGQFLRSIRKSNRVTWDEHFQLTSFERYSRLSRYVLERLPSVLPGYRNQALQNIVKNYAMVQVTSLQSLEGEWSVYDFTVDELHNFLANCLVIHNTSLLDKIRGTAVQAREAGGITQEIGASFFPMETLEAISGNILNKSGGELKIPGLLVIDTPGHEIFSNLRYRGGSAADIAVLLVDVLKGLENQTIESIEILKKRKVPFLVALNKVDIIKGWKKGSSGLLSTVMKQQPPEWNDELEERLYNVVGGLSKHGFDSDAFYRVKDFKRQVSIVPVSARQGVGIPELLAMLIGLAQQFLSGKLANSEEARRARGIILELQQEPGIGETANVILTEGSLRVGDRIVLVRRGGGFESRVKALFMPRPLDEMRDPRDKFTPVGEVHSAAGVKLVTPDLEGVIAGTQVISVKEDSELEEAKREAEKELETIVRKTDKLGVIVKAGNIGGLEALLTMLNEREVPVRMADIGDISKTEIFEAAAVGEHDPYLGAIIAFDAKVLPEAKDYAKDSHIFASEVIYDAIESYVQWAAKAKEDAERTALATITVPAKFRALPNHFFRRNDPAVFGVEIMAGKLRPKTRIMDAQGRPLGVVEQIQDQGKSVPEAKAGSQVAISVKGPTLGRQIRENDTIYTFPRSHETKLLRSKYLASLAEDELATLKEISDILLMVDPLYGF